MHASTIGIIVHLLIEVILITRVMTRPHREPASRIAWVAVIAALPFLGVLIYLLFGETNIGRRRVGRHASGCTVVARTSHSSDGHLNRREHSHCHQADNE